MRLHRDVCMHVQCACLANRACSPSQTWHMIGKHVSQSLQGACHGMWQCLLISVRRQFSGSTLYGMEYFSMLVGLLAQHPSFTLSCDVL